MAAPKSRSLVTLLVAGTVALLCVSVAVLFAVGSGLLSRLVEEESRARVGLAARTAHETIDRDVEAVATSARLLAERPTLSRLLAGDDRAALAEFLDRFAKTSGLSGAAVLGRDGLIVHGGLDPPQAAVELPPGGTGGVTTALLGRRGEAVVIAARAEIASIPGDSIRVYRTLDEAAMARLTEQIGLETRVRPPEGWELGLEITTTPGAGWTAVEPLHGASDRVEATVEVFLPSAGAEADLASVRWRLLGVSLGIVIGAAVLGLILARRLTRPLAGLARAADRIGTGDLNSPVPRAGGRETAQLASTMDEMRLRLLETTDELRRRSAESDAILTGVVEGVFSVDANRRILYVNAPMAASLGVTPEAAAGTFCGDLLNPVEPDGTRPCESRCPILAARVRGRAFAAETLVASDGSKRSVVITSSAPTVSAAPGPGSVQFQVLRDETELESGRRLRDLVVANISHEFRTPLSAQRASLEMLRERLSGEDRHEDRTLFEAIDRASLRLMRLVDNLLESARIEAGRDMIRLAPVALDEVVEEAADLAAPLLALRKQTLDVEIPYPLPMVSGDSARLVQVFVNLLANANKYAPEASAIRVGGEVLDGSVSLWVEDEGPGLPPEGGEALFGRFVRSLAEEPAEGGMGLGLWIVRSIVTRHGGRVSAAAGPGGRGTRIVVTLPEASATRAAARA